jgi:hypothetical protein
VDGPHDDIKSIVMIQRPSTLDTACALALVQEKVVDSSRKREFMRSEPFSHRMVQKIGLSLSTQPKFDKTPGNSVAEDKTGT